MPGALPEHRRRIGRKLEGFEEVIEATMGQRLCSACRKKASRRCPTRRSVATIVWGWRSTITAR